MSTNLGEGGLPILRVFDGVTSAQTIEIQVYDPAFTGCVFVSAGYIGNDGTFEVVTGGGPQVNVFNFPALDLLFSFYSGDPANTGGIFVS